MAPRALGFACPGSFTVKTAPRRGHLISLAAAAEHLDVSTKTLRRRIADGTLPAYRVGRLVKVNPDDLDRIAQPIPAAGGGRVA